MLIKSRLIIYCFFLILIDCNVTISRVRMKDNLRSVEHGADTINWLAISRELERAKHGGMFFRDRKKEIKHLPLSDTGSNDSNSHRRALWSWLSSMLI
jgi:hypothetical protein